MAPNHRPPLQQRCTRPSINMSKSDNIFSNVPAILSHKEEGAKVVTTSNLFLKQGKPFDGRNVV
jgi:hypothetical protein